VISRDRYGWIYLCAFDASGNLLWQQRVGGVISEISPPVVAKGIVYAGADTGDLYAFNASTGKLLWNYNTGGQWGLYSPPVVVNGVLYVTFSFWGTGQQVLAFDANTGVMLWAYGHGSDGEAVLDAVAVANGLVYAWIGPHHDSCPYQEYTYWLQLLDANTGVERGRYISCIQLSPYYVHSPLIYNGTPYFTMGTTVFGGGSLNWRYDTGALVLSAPVAENGVVYVGADQTYALNAATGALLWRSMVVGDRYAVANGVLYLASYSGGTPLYALDAASGAILWQYSDSGLASPVVTDGTLYAGDSLGNLLAFGLPQDGSGPPKCPDPKALVPNYSLKPSTPVAATSNSQQLN
jgi:outer membrane protein assembly factor BamB